jgi:hypothetical protein
MHDYQDLVGVLATKEGSAIVANTLRIFAANTQHDVDWCQQLIDRLHEIAAIAVTQAAPNARRILADAPRHKWLRLTAP